MTTTPVAFAAALLASFAAPSVRAADDVPPEAVVATLPFLAAEEPNRIVVDLARDGSTPFRLMLDTGASHSALTPLAARAAGVTVRALKQTPYRRKTRVGRDLQFHVDTSSSDTGSRTGWEWGLLGANFLEAYVVELDFTMRTVRLLDPKRFAVPEAPPEGEQATIPFRGSNRPVIEIAIGDRRVPLTIDTGAPDGVILSGRAARRAGIDVDALAPFGTADTVMGPMELRFHEAPELTIGGMRFEHVPIVVAPKGWYGMVGESDDSIVGYDLLSRFLVRIDYPRRRVWLRRESERTTYQGVDYALTREAGAFLWTGKDGFGVLAVLPGTPAAQIGLRPGDVVPRRAQAKTPEAVLLAIRDGRPVTVARDEDGVLADVELRPAEAAAAH
ncbi:MAG: hypothetical protein DCC71_08445 [Proteobacteria bacterium]|nr:MAG: hypothetical protein DCC71_08445 [Pseudomonadota bacterium]